MGASIRLGGHSRFGGPTRHTLTYATSPGGGSGNHVRARFQWEGPGVLLGATFPEGRHS